MSLFILKKYLSLKYFFVILVVLFAVQLYRNRGKGMTKNIIKDSKYIIICYVVFALIVLSSLISNFNIYDLVYLISITYFVIRYFVLICRKK